MSTKPPVSLSYRDAGVDIDAGDALIEAIKPFAKRTMREGVLAGIGGFGALFEVSKKYREPVLVSGTAADLPFYRFLCLIPQSSIVCDHVHKAPGFPLLS